MSSRRAEADHLLRAIGRVCARARDPLDLLEEVARLVRSRVPYDTAGWILVDPDTLLVNGVYGEGVERDTHLRLVAAELSEVEDVNRFVDLARAGVAAAALGGATGGDLSRSARWREVYEPLGYGDELRAVFADGSAVWGQACLTRRAEEPCFDPAEVELLRRAAPHVAHGIRTSLVVTEGPEAAGDEPGLVVLRDDGSVESATPFAVRWFGDLEDESLRSVIVLHEVALRARALAQQDAAADDPPARAWARTLDGGTVLVRGTRLDDGSGPGRTALVLDPARRADVAPLLMRLGALTDRERQVTQLLLTGRSTRDIAADLWISPETLRGHVKSVHAKLGVSSRAELFALLAHEPRSRMRPAAPADRRTE